LNQILIKMQEWQKGASSTLLSLNRVELHNKWLKNLHKLIREEIRQEKLKSEDNTIQGFEGLKMS